MKWEGLYNMLLEGTVKGIKWVGLCNILYEMREGMYIIWNERDLLEMKQEGWIM